MTTQEFKALLVQGKQLNGQLHLHRKKILQYGEAAYLLLVLFLSLENLAAEDGSRILNLSAEVPSGDALLQQLKKLSLDDVEEQFDRLYRRQFKRLFQGRKRPRVIAIIDVHEQETYTKHKRTSQDVRGGKHKNGTNYFFHFATLQIIAGERVMTLAVRLHRRDESLRELVIELVKHAQQYVHIDVLLLDRGFRDARLVNDLEFLKIPLLMPSFSDERTRKALAETWLTKARRWSFAHKNKEHADVTLLKVTRSDGTSFGFYTTLRATWLHRVQHYVDLYAKRWNIETGYRVQQEFLPKTTCIKGPVHLFYFSYAIAIHNLWLCSRLIVGKTVKFTVAYLKYLLRQAFQRIILDHG